MKKIFYTALLVVFGAMSCKTSQNNTKSDLAQVNYSTLPTQPNGIWKFESAGTFSRKKEVEIVFYHEGKQPVNLTRPMELKLEFEENGKWRTVRTLYCPCLQNCPPPPYQREVAPQDKQTFKWKPEEQWCEESAKSAPAPVGKYRLVINHTVNMEKKLYFQHYEFTLTK